MRFARQPPPPTFLNYSFFCVSSLTGILIALLLMSSSNSLSDMALNWLRGGGGSAGKHSTSSSAGCLQPSASQSSMVPPQLFTADSADSLGGGDNDEYNADAPGRASGVARYFAHVIASKPREYHDWENSDLEIRQGNL